MCSPEEYEVAFECSGSSGLPLGLLPFLPALASVLNWSIYSVVVRPTSIHCFSSVLVSLNLSLVLAHAGVSSSK